MIALVFSEEGYSSSSLVFNPLIPMVLVEGLEVYDFKWQLTTP